MILAFIEQLALAALVFIPLERLCALHRNRVLLREGLLLDLTHAFATGAIFAVGLAIVVLIAMALSSAVVPQSWRDAIASQPTALQFIEVLLIADLGFYLAHRAFHRIPFLWRFHAIHHSIEQLDWIAAHRVHPADQIMTKGASLVPVLALGFESTAIAAFGMLYHWQSLLVHSNVRLRFGPLRWLLASPQFHHWHHANHPEAFDRNFAGQLPIWDVLFGTAFMPGAEMPKRYGTDDPVPMTYLAQLAYPLSRRHRRTLEPASEVQRAA